jgi:hypothetical protein
VRQLLHADEKDLEDEGAHGGGRQKTQRKHCTRTSGCPHPFKHRGRCVGWQAKTAVAGVSGKKRKRSGSADRAGRRTKRQASDKNR